MKIGKIHGVRDCTADSMEPQEDVEKSEQDYDESDNHNPDQAQSHYHIEDLKETFKRLYAGTDRKSGTEIHDVNRDGKDVNTGDDQGSRDQRLLNQQLKEMNLDKRVLNRLANKRADKYYNAYIESLDRNTPGIFFSPEKTSLDSAERDEDLSEEELTDIWDHDPGYININATKKFEGETDPGQKREVIRSDSLYLETGLDRGGYENWDDYYDHDAGEPELITLDAGSILERYGYEDGKFLTESGKDFSVLHLNKTPDKLEHHRYEVLQPFPVEQSYVGKQPFDEPGQEENEKKVIQYRSMICIEDLIELGFLKELR